MEKTKRYFACDKCSTGAVVVTKTVSEEEGIRVQVKHCDTCGHQHTLSDVLKDLNEIACEK